MSSIRMTSNLDPSHSSGPARESWLTDWRTDEPPWMSADEQGGDFGAPSLLVPCLIGVFATTAAILMVLLTFL